MKNLLIILLLLPLLARDPFSWPTPSTAQSSYCLIGIIYNSVTQQYTALLTYDKQLYFVHLYDLLPDKSVITAITATSVQITLPSAHVITIT